MAGKVDGYGVSQLSYDAMLTNVTDIVQRYRLALRYIWNSCIWADPTLRDLQSVESFRTLKLPMFKTLVADPLELVQDEIFGEAFEVVPGEAGYFNALTLNVIEPQGWLGSGHWHPVEGGPFKADDVRLTLLDFFDWSPLGYIDFRYYMVRVHYLRGHPEATGHEALVDVNEAQVFLRRPEAVAESGAGAPNWET